MRNLTKTNGSGRLMPASPTFSFFDDFLGRNLFDWESGNNANGNTLPAVNVSENNDNYELEVAAPGMNKKDFKVELDNDQLVISAERHLENKSEKDIYNRVEFSYQNFTRTFKLPERSVQGDKIKATYKDGILYITIPKTENAKTKPPRQIEIA